jgi:hypothetical protein
MEKLYTKNNDKFHTKLEVARDCVDELKKYVDLETSVVVEPSAGNGAFLNFLPPHTIGLDIAPEDERIAKQDFFEYDHPPSDKKTIVVGNPPFGICNKLSIGFFNHAAKFADVIAFIIPLTWRKRSINIRLNRNFHLVSDTILSRKAFDDPKVHVFCCFQIWEKRNDVREIEPRRYAVTDWKFSNIGDCDFALKKSCCKAGKIFATTDVPADKRHSFFYIKVLISDKDSVVDTFKRADYSCAEWVCNRESLSQGEAEREYMAAKK